MIYVLIPVILIMAAYIASLHSEINSYKKRIESANRRFTELDNLNKGLKVSLEIMKEDLKILRNKKNKP